MNNQRSIIIPYNTSLNNSRNYVVSPQTSNFLDGNIEKITGVTHNYKNYENVTFNVKTDIKIASNDDKQSIGSVKCSFCDEINAGIKWFSKKEDVEKSVCYDCLFYNLYKVDAMARDMNS